MEQGLPRYLTKTFQTAAAFSRHEQLQFISNLPNSPFYRPDSNNTFRDTAVFCLHISEQDPRSFAGDLNIPASLLLKWTEEQHLPYPLLRTIQAKNMIEAALYANGWVGHPPRPPVMDGSNIVPLFKGRAP